MGARSSTPDLFSFASDRAASTASVNSTSNTSVRHILPNDLARAVKHLDYQELDRLLSAVLVEQKRRGKKRPDSDEISRKRQFKAVAIPLTQGKLNAVRAGRLRLLGSMGTSSLRCPTAGPLRSHLIRSAAHQGPDSRKFNDLSNNAVMLLSMVKIATFLSDYTRCVSTVCVVLRSADHY